MSQEIERKFLINGNFRNDVYASSEISQGYLSSIPERSVRIRIRGVKAFLTVKGIGDEQGVSRFEWEKEIAVDEARELMKLCEPGRIEKVRHLVKSGDHIIEVDEFSGDNEGLIIAEIELSSEDEPFIKPQWLGEEVTGIAKYYNAALVHHPYKMW